MALNPSQKQEVVAELAEIAAKAHSLVAAEYAGTTVSQMTAMRKKARESGVFVKVVKNTLASRAVAGTDFECFAQSARIPIPLPVRTGSPISMNCSIVSELGGLSKEAFLHAGKRRLLVSFKGEQKETHALSFCFDLPEEILAEVFKSNNTESRRFLNPDCE